MPEPNMPVEANLPPMPAPPDAQVNTTARVDIPGHHPLAPTQLHAATLPSGEMAIAQIGLITAPSLSQKINPPQVDEAALQSTNTLPTEKTDKASVFTKIGKVGSKPAAGAMLVPSVLGGSAVAPTLSDMLQSPPAVHGDLPQHLQPGKQEGKNTIEKPAVPEQEGVKVTYSAGWQMVSITSGTQFDNPANIQIAYSYTPENGYQTIEDIAKYSGAAWVYFGDTTGAQLGVGTNDRQTVKAPRGGGWMMANNPNGQETVSLSSGSAYVLDRQTGEYKTVTTLDPGQGGWIYLNDGQSVDIVSPLHKGSAESLSPAEAAAIIKSGKLDFRDKSPDYYKNFFIPIDPETAKQLIFDAARNGDHRIFFPVNPEAVSVVQISYRYILPTNVPQVQGGILISKDTTLYPFLPDSHVNISSPAGQFAYMAADPSATAAMDYTPFNPEDPSQLDLSLRSPAGFAIKAEIPLPVNVLQPFAVNAGVTPNTRLDQGLLNLSASNTFAVNTRAHNLPDQTITSYNVTFVTSSRNVSGVRVVQPNDDTPFLHDPNGLIYYIQH